jgi:hypothetical protein
MIYEEFKDISLSLINDISFEDFQILCSSFNYSEEYIKTIWKHHSNKPLDVVVFHDRQNILCHVVTKRS